MAKYLVDGRLTVRVADIPVTLDDNDPRPHIEQVTEAFAKALEDRLTILDIKGARGGQDGHITSFGVASVHGWDQVD